MILQEDYELSYSLFLAEQELFENMIYTNAYITEADVEVINEALGRNVGKYIEKVTKSAEKAWTRFRNKVASKKQIELLKTSAKEMAKDGVSFRINNYHNYSLNNFTTNKVKVFDMETMKDHLAGPQKYLNAYYPNIAKDGKVYKNYLALIDRGKSNITMDSRSVQPLYKFCTKDFYTYRKSIEDDLEAINKSTQLILGECSNMISISNNSKVVCESMLLEAPTTVGNAKANDKMSFSTNTGGEVQSNKKGQVTFSKAIHVYVKCSMDIISAKMKILRQIYLDYFEILDYYIALASVQGMDIKKDKKSNIKSSQIKIK